MAWTEITRRSYRRDGLRYASNLADEEWHLIEPLTPPARRGRPRERDLRKVVDAILYIASTGCQWRQLPREFPPYSTVRGYSTHGRAREPSPRSTTRSPWRRAKGKAARPALRRR